MKRICIFRHGETDWNLEGRFQGHTDIPLNERGREQARQLAPRLRELGVEAILSSDLARALETARLAAGDLDIPIRTTPGLREAYLGEAQGLTADEMARRFGEEVHRRWRSCHPTDADVSYPGGETGAEVMKRALEAIGDFLSSEPFTVVGISCHGGVIRRVMQHVLPPGSPPVPIPNGVLYQLDVDLEAGAWKLAGQ